MRRAGDECAALSRGSRNGMPVSKLPWMLVSYQVLCSPPGCDSRMAI